MRCSVVFGVTLRLFVINISSTSPVNNKRRRLLPAVVSQLVTVRRRPCWQHLAAVATLTASSEVRYWLRIAISAYPICIRRPRWGEGSSPNIAMPFDRPTEKLECLATRRWKIFEDMFIRFDTTHERDRQTHTDTAWWHRPRYATIRRGHL